MNGPIELADGALLPFPLIGPRGYVRAIDVIDAFMTLCPGARRITFRFSRPLSGPARVSLSRVPRAAATIRVEWGHSVQEVFLVGTGLEAEHRADAPLKPHIAAWVGANHQCYLLGSKASAGSMLEICFAHFQHMADRRFVVRSIEITPLPSRPAEVIWTGRMEKQGSRERWTAWRNFRRWLTLEMVPAQTGEIRTPPESQRPAKPDRGS